MLEDTHKLFRKEEIRGSFHRKISKSKKSLCYDVKGKQDFNQIRRGEKHKKTKTFFKLSCQAIDTQLDSISDNFWLLL